MMKTGLVIVLAVIVSIVIVTCVSMYNRDLEEWKTITNAEHPAP